MCIYILPIACLVDIHGICLLSLLSCKVLWEVGLAHLQDVDDGATSTRSLGMRLRSGWLLQAKAGLETDLETGSVGIFSRGGALLLFTLYTYAFSQNATRALVINLSQLYSTCTHHYLLRTGLMVTLYQGHSSSREHSLMVSPCSSVDMIMNCVLR